MQKDMRIATFSKYFIAVALFGIASFGFVAHAQQTGGGQPPEQGVTPNTLSGYAWSSTIGWVSLSGSGYGVSVENNGKMAGYAWSSNVGWISFNTSDTTQCPSGSCQARFNAQTGDVTGWARAIAGGSAQSGNWDGWIYLGQSSNVGVSVTGCAWSGYAWGGGENTLNGVIGWLSFAGPGYAVTGTGNACAAGDPDLTTGETSVEKISTGGESDTSVIFSAPISNIGGGNISEDIDMYVQIAYDSDHGADFDENFSKNAAITGGITPGGTKTASYTLDNPRSGRHQVRVCADRPNNEIAEADEENNCGPVTTFQINGGGQPLDFSCSADDENVSVGEEVTWSIYDLEGNVGVTTYSWSGDENLSGTNNSVTKTYTSTGTKTASLAVTAENASKTVNCTGSVGGTSCDGCGVTVTSPPSVNLNATPDRLTVGDDISLVWSTQNYTGSSCTATGFTNTQLTNGSSEVTPNGTVIGTPSAGVHTYRIVCGSADPVDETVTVLNPNITITANGEEESVRIAKVDPDNPDTVAIAWDAEDVDSCVVRESTGSLTGDFPASTVSGSRAPIITDRTVFTLTCEAEGNEYVNSVTVNVPPDFEEF